MNTITELTITRSKWYRGQGPLGSRLLRSCDRTMCCLGFFCKACGLSDDEILEKASPFSLVSTPPQLHSVRNLIAANDAQLMDDSRRESQIAALMLELSPPVKVTFVD